MTTISSRTQELLIQTKIHRSTSYMRTKLLFCVLKQMKRKVMTVLYDNFIGKWTHITIVLTQDLFAIITANCYINGEIVTNQLKLLSIFLNQRMLCFSLDLYWGTMLTPIELNIQTNSQMQKWANCIMYNRVLTNDDILSAFQHKAPVKGRIIS